MPSLSTILNGEITRLARKEIKAAIDPVRKANAGHRKEIAELKRQVASLQRDLKAASKPSTARVEADEASTRFSAKGLKSLRAKLGLSAAEFRHHASRKRIRATAGKNAARRCASRNVRAPPTPNFFYCGLEARQIP